MGEERREGFGTPSTKVRRSSLTCHALLAASVSGVQLSDNVVESLPSCSQVLKSEKGHDLCWNLCRDNAEFIEEERGDSK